MKTKNEIIIMHDTFLYKGGGEKVMLIMAKTLGSDLTSGFFSTGSFDLRKEGFTGKMIPLTNEVFKKGIRHLQLKYAFLYKTKFLSEYKTVIFSGDCLTATRSCSKDAKKIFFCHTPPRYLYDLKDLYLKKTPLLLKPVFLLLSYFFKKMYEKDIKNIDLILANSETTKKRIKNFLGLDAQVLYPPVIATEFKFIGQKDYYLSYARISDAKRVDIIVEAFKQLPDKKVLIVYGENDPQKDKVMELAKGYENIQFITFPGNTGFYECVGNALATIYIPIDEDFGMSPVESMAAGKPVIGVNEGGLKETIIHNKTGIFIKEGAPVNELIDAVKILTPEKCLEMKNDCIERSKDFGIDQFEKQLKSYL